MSVNLNPTMGDAMAMDLGGLFAPGAKEIQVEVLVEDATERIRAFLNDQVFSEDEDIGGQQLVDLVELHFQTTVLPEIANETVLTVFVPAGAANGKKKIVLTSKLANDNNELIVTARAA